MSPKLVGLQNLNVCSAFQILSIVIETYRVVYYVDLISPPKLTHNSPLGTSHITHRGQAPSQFPSLSS